MPDAKMVFLGVLPNGCHLYREPNEAGGHTYYSDECGCMSRVWDTCIASEGTLISVMACEQHRAYLTHMIDGGWRPQDMEKEQMAVIGSSFIPPDIQARLDRLAETENG